MIPELGVVVEFKSIDELVTAVLEVTPVESGTEVEEYGGGAYWRGPTRFGMPSTCTSSASPVQAPKHCTQSSRGSP
jgi:hypothetical protein